MSWVLRHAQVNINGGWPTGKIKFAFMGDPATVWPEVQALGDSDWYVNPYGIPSFAVGRYVAPGGVYGWATSGVARVALPIAVPEEVENYVVSAAAYLEVRSIGELAETLPDFRLWWGGFSTDTPSPEGGAGPNSYGGVLRSPASEILSLEVPADAESGLWVPLIDAGAFLYNSSPPGLKEMGCVMFLVAEDETTEPTPGSWDSMFEFAGMVLDITYRVQGQPGTGPVVNVGAPGAVSTHSGRHGSGSTVHI